MILNVCYNDFLKFKKKLLFLKSLQHGSFCHNTRETGSFTVDLTFWGGGGGGGLDRAILSKLYFKK